MRVAVLGRLRIEVAALADGRPDVPVELRGLRQRLLVAALALHPGTAVGSGALADMVWSRPPADEAGAAAAVHVVVSRARSSLARHVGAARARELLRTTGDGYLLAVRAGDVDAVELVRLTEAARAALDAGDPVAAAATSAAAVGLLRGEPLPEVTQAGLDWPVHHELTRRMRQAVEVWAQAHLRAGRPGVVAAELERQAALRPIDERLAELTMIALHRLGRVADAEAVFRRCRAALAEELGVTPGPRLSECRRRLPARPVTAQPDAVAALRSAAQFALGSGGYQQAIDAYRALLASAAPMAPHEHAELLRSLGEALYHQHGRGEPELRAAATEFLGAGAPHDAAHALTLLARRRWLAGGRSDAAGLLAQAMRLLDTAREGSAAAAALATAAGVLAAIGRHAEAQHAARRAVALSDVTQPVRAQALSNLGMSRVLSGDLVDGERDLASAMALRRTLGVPPSTAALVTLADAHARMGRLRSSRRLLADATAVAQALHRDADLLWQDGERLTTLFWARRWGALDLAAQEFVVKVAGEHHMSANGLLSQARLRLARGRHAEAARLAADACVLARRAGNTGAILSALAIRGSVARARRGVAPVAEELLSLLAGTSLPPDTGVPLALALRAAGVAPGDVLRVGVAPSPWLDAVLAVLAGDLAGARERYVALGSHGDAALLR